VIDGFSAEVGDLDALAHLFRAVGNQAPHAIRRALNWTGDKARTKVVRVLARQTGAKYGAVRRAVVTKRANYGRLVYRLVAFGGYLSLKEFGARQRRDGVSAAPWGRRTVFRHAFVSSAMGGHVFVREILPSGQRAGRLPLRQLWGPAIPREMLKGDTAEAFAATVGAELQPRVEHELLALLKGHAPRG
jgi:hypothetical protein